MTVLQKVPKMRPPLERIVQAGIIDLFRKIGIHVGSTSQYRASHVVEGLPDLICHALAINTFFWFESKSYLPSWSDGDQVRRFNPYERSTWRPHPLSEKQQEFRDRALACGVRHYWGGFPQAEDALIDLGLAYRAASGVLILKSAPQRRTADAKP